MRPYDELGFEVWRGLLPPTLVLSVLDAAYASADRANAYPGVDGRRIHLTNVHRTFDGVREILARLPMRDLLPPGLLAVTHSKFAFKTPSVEHRWLPHQDLAYKPPGSKRRGVVFVVPLEVVDERNGALEVFPRSHELGLLRHRAVGDQLEVERPLPWAKIDEVAGRSPLPLVLAPGDVAAMSLGTVHQSGPNSHPTSLRAILFVEIEPHAEGLIDDLGGPPVVLAMGVPDA